MNESLMNEGTFWLPKAASDVAEHNDKLFYILMWASAITFIVLTGFILFYLFKYRVTEKRQVADTQKADDLILEFSWTIIPTILVLFLFWFGFKDFLSVSIPPTNAMEIHVTAKKWLWEFNYPETGKKTINELTVPVGRAVKLIMASGDVLHSFYLPNFRVKRDLIPNRYTITWFEANRKGQFQVFCTEYCGDGHSNMGANLSVVSNEEFQEWLNDTSDGFGEDIPLDEIGKKLYTKNGCNACHSINGDDGVGPTWKALYMANREMADGSIVVADENYLKESIIYPAAKIAKGYPNVMPSYAGLLNDEEINAIIEYIKTIK